MRRILVTFAALALVSMLGAPATADHEPPPPWPTHDRLYLMAADSDHAYWSVDPNDPELRRRNLVQHCGATETWRFSRRQKPCFYGGLPGLGYFYTTFFGQGSLFETPPSWTKQDPLRFHFELGVEALADYEVGLVVQSGDIFIESDAATEVSPGVFEGEIDLDVTLQPDAFTYFGVRVNTTSERVITDIALRGGSWLQLPALVGAKSVPRLLAEDTYAPAATSFESDTRALTFNDADWEAWSFEGDVADPRSFDIALERDPVAVIAWVEAFDRTFVQDVLRGGQVDQRKLTDGVRIRLFRDGEELERSAGPYLGQGTAALASTTISGGPLTVTVDGMQQGETPLEFDAHVVAVFGERTLDSMQWVVNGDHYLRLPVTAICPGASEPVPVTDEVRTFRVGMDVDTEAVGSPAFTLRYFVPTSGEAPCGEDAGGDWVRFTLPGERVWYVGATPAQHGTFVSAYDTTFTFDVRYTYTAPPKEHEA